MGLSQKSLTGITKFFLFGVSLNPKLLKVKTRQGPSFKGSIWLNNSVIAIYIIWAVGRSENPGEGSSCNVVGMISLSWVDMPRSKEWGLEKETKVNP